MKWRNRTIRDLVVLQRGYDLTDSEREDGTVPVIGSAGPNGFHAVARARGPGVTIGRSGGSIGKVTFVEQDFWPHNTCIFVTDFKGNDERFVAYLLSTLDLAQLNSGAAQPSLNRNFVYGVHVRYPDPPEQARIGSILSSYEALIENNTRRIALLEQGARHLYEEWFVRLRFPGREHTPITNGVPKGWERKKLIELCASVDYGYTASADLEAVGPKFLRITDIVPPLIDWSAVPFCPIEEARLEKFRLGEGDIVIARTGATVGYAKRLHKRHPEAVFASYLVRLRPRADVESLILGVFVESQAYKDYVLAHVGGAAQPNANAQVLAAAEILMPTRTIQRQFRQFVEPLVDLKEILQVQNQKLREARDLLLPKLMSGEIAV